MKKKKKQMKKIVAEIQITSKIQKIWKNKENMNLEILMKNQMKKNYNLNMNPDKNSFIKIKLGLRISF